MKIHPDKALEILQLHFKHQDQVDPQDLNDAITLAIEAILEHKKRRARYPELPSILLPHEQPY